MDYKYLNDYEMVYRVRENDDEAMRMVFEKYEPVVLSLAKKYYTILKQHGAEMDDLIQEARIAIVKALNSYDSEKDSTFYTYVSICINRQLITCCRNLTATKNAPLNYSVSDDCLYVVGDISNDPSNYFMKQQDMEDFVRSKNLLDFRDANIFELRYNGFSYKEISVLLDLPFSTVDSRLCKIRRTLQGIRNKF